MGYRFRKSVNFGPLRINASKSGLGWSVGVPGARYTKMANGRTRRTASIPGTGISFVEESKKPVEEPAKDNFDKVVKVVGRILMWVGIIAFAFICVLLDESTKGGKR